MSEYQYYEFQAVDRPLGETERGELRAISTRASISATSFVNTYEWGDLKADPVRLVARYFDLFLYVANWRTRRFAMRLPKRLVARDELTRFVVDDEIATVKETGEHLIVDICRGEVDSEEWEDGSGRLASLAPLRADILNGDLRVFYLVWLMAVADGTVEDDAVEPLAGIAPLTASLEAFADFFLIDPDLVAAAAAPLRPAASPGASAEAFLRALPEDEKIALLLRLHDGGDPHLGAELRRRARASGESPGEGRVGRRTAAELREIASGLATERERAAGARAEAERQRRDREEAALRERRLAALAARGEVAWREAESLIELRNAAAYEKAVALLADLRALAARSCPEEFRRRLQDIRTRHERKSRFIELVAAAALE